MWSLLGLILILIIRKKVAVKRGELFLGYVTWYSFGRFFVEGMRTDSLYFFGELRVSQVLSLVLLLEESLYYIIDEKTNRHQVV